MSVNRNRPHLLVLPEDDANREMAEGFFLDSSFLSLRNRFQVLPVAGGWRKVLERFHLDLMSDLERYPERVVLLLLDFDQQIDRLEIARSEIPEPLRDRVFILGVWSEPEALKAALGKSCEAIGQELARDCREDQETTWEHSLLRHNADELVRLRERVRSFLFPSL